MQILIVTKQVQQQESLVSNGPTYGFPFLTYVSPVVCYDTGKRFCQEGIIYGSTKQEERNACAIEFKDS